MKLARKCSFANVMMSAAPVRIFDSFRMVRYVKVLCHYLFPLLKCEAWKIIENIDGMKLPLVLLLDFKTKISKCRKSDKCLITL